MDRREFVASVAASTAATRLAQPTNPSHAARLIIDGVSPSVLDSRYLGMLKSAGVTGWNKTLGDLKSFADAWNFLDAHSTDVKLAVTAADITRAAEGGYVALLFGWQSADALGEVNGTHGTPLRAFHQLGLRTVNLVYNIMNQFAGGCLEPTLGLTKAGRRLVEEIHSLKIVLDVGGHTGERSSLDALEMSRGVPVVCTHTNMAGLIDNPRNISDRVAVAIAGTGGVIGLTAINDFNARNRRDAAVKVTPQAGLNALLDQYDYLKRLVGIDHVGMGCDFTEGPPTTIDPTLPMFTAEMASTQSPIYYVKGFERITELPNLVAGLKSRGWSEGDLDKALGLNWLRVYRQVFGA